MSLGLGDLKKKAGSQKSGNAESAPRATRPTQAARPWDASGLSSRAPRAKNRLDASGAAMNEDLATSHDHLFTFETLADMKMDEIRDTVERLQNQVRTKIERATSGPLEIFKSVLTLVK